MFCKNCGTKLNENDKYCIGCGNLVNMNKISTNNSNLSQDNYISKNNESNTANNFDEKFIKSYMGSKADKMYDSVKKGGLNIWAILFGYGYFAYRKMYLISIIIVVLFNILNFLIPHNINHIGIIVGFLFCPIYKWDITRKLRKIKKDNPNANESQLLSIAKNKGGTSIIGTILFFVIYFLIILFIFYLFYLFQGDINYEL